MMRNSHLGVRYVMGNNRGMKRHEGVSIVPVLGKDASDSEGDEFQVGTGSGRRVWGKAVKVATLMP